MDLKLSEGTKPGISTNGHTPNVFTTPKRKIDEDPSRPNRRSQVLCTSRTDESQAKRRLIFYSPQRNSTPVSQNHETRFSAVIQGESFYANSRLNFEQTQVRRRIMNSLKNRVMEPKQSRMFFLDGPAGSGKSHLAITIYYEATAKGFKVVTSASTSIAATLLPGGLTAHKQFGLFVPQNSQACRMNESSVHAEHLRRADMIIWDEVSSSYANHLTVADALMRRLTAIDVPFGGKVVIFAGDFRQSVPIMRNASPETVIRNSFFAYPVWSEITTLSLFKNMRVDNIDFAEFLLETALAGYYSSHTSKPYALIDADMCVRTINQLIKAAFGECLHVRYPDTFGRAILTLTNAESLELNERVLRFLQPQEPEIHIDGRVGSDRSDESINIDFYTIRSDEPPTILKLKRGSNIILLCNDEATGLANGTFLIVDEITSNCLNCTIRTGPMAGEKAKITKKKYRKILHQFPVRLSYAMTVNKAYGLNFQKVGLFLNSGVFAHGQLYFALSRVRRREDVKLYLDPSSLFTNDMAIVRGNGKIAIKNKVWEEVLDKILKRSLF